MEQHTPQCLCSKGMGSFWNPRGQHGRKTSYRAAGQMRGPRAKRGGEDKQWMRKPASWSQLWECLHRPSTCTLCKSHHLGTMTQKSLVARQGWPKKWHCHQEGTPTGSRQMRDPFSVLSLLLPTSSPHTPLSGLVKPKL